MPMVQDTYRYVNMGVPEILKGIALCIPSYWSLNFSTVRILEPFTIPKEDNQIS